MTSSCSKFPVKTPKFSDGERVRVPPDAFSKRKKAVYGWVFGNTRGGGWCRGTGKEVRTGNILVYVRLTNKFTAPCYTYSEDFLIPVKSKK